MQIFISLLLKSVGILPKKLQAPSCGFILLLQQITLIAWKTN